MTVAVIYFDKKKQGRTQRLLEILKETARTRCDDIRVLNGYTLADTDRLNMYGYIAVFCAEKPFFSSKPDPAVLTALKDHGLSGNSKGCVLTVHHGFFSAKFARNVMNKLESTGFRIDYFDILKNPADVRRAGQNIG